MILHGLSSGRGNLAVAKLFYLRLLYSIIEVQQSGF